MTLFFRQSKEFFKHLLFVYFQNVCAWKWDGKDFSLIRRYHLLFYMWRHWNREVEEVACHHTASSEGAGSQIRSLAPEPVLPYMYLLYWAASIGILVLKCREKGIPNMSLLLLAGVYQGKFLKFLLLEMMHVKHLYNLALGRLFSEYSFQSIAFRPAHPRHLGVC